MVLEKEAWCKWENIGIRESMLHYKILNVCSLEIMWALESMHISCLVEILRYRISPKDNDR